MISDGLSGEDFLHDFSIQIWDSGEVSWQTCPDQHQLLLQGVHAPLHGKRILRRQGLGHGLEHP